MIQSYEHIFATLTIISLLHYVTKVGIELTHNMILFIALKHKMMLMLNNVFLQYNLNDSQLRQMCRYLQSTFQRIRNSLYRSTVLYTLSNVMI